MSKYLKSLLTDDIKRRLTGVQDALVVKVEGLTSLANNTLRKQLKAKKINLLVVKNSLARRALAGTPLAAAFEQMSGPAAVIWGGDDIVSVAKEVMRLKKEKPYEKMEPRGGAIDGAGLSEGEVEQVSKWPTRTEQLSMLVGQIVGVGGKLSSQFTAMGAKLASQVKKKSEGSEDAAGSPEGGAAGDAAPSA